MTNLFATQVYQKKILFDLVDLKFEAEHIKKIDKQGQIWSAKNYKNGFTSYGSMDQLHKLSSTFKNLEKKINLHVGKYLKNLDYNASEKNLKMTNCWVNIMSKGALHTAHIHPQSVISGTYYVSIPAGASSIKFEDPRLSFFMNSPVIKEKAKLSNQRFVNLQPKAGDLVLFESWLKHEVPTNETTQSRISVSFNYDWI
ncbi:MAG: TIGR02466 family protein [Pseudobdellovibrio sp.]